MTNFGLVISIFVALIIFGILRKKKEDTSMVERAEEDSESEEASKTEEEIDLNQEFFKKAEVTNEEAIDAIVCNSQADLILLRSVLYSCGIQTYAKNQYIADLKLGWGFPGFTKVTLVLFKDDIDEAKKIIEDYRNKSEQPIESLIEFLV